MESFVIDFYGDEPYSYYTKLNFIELIEIYIYFNLISISNRHLRVFYGYSMGIQSR